MLASLQIHFNNWTNISNFLTNSWRLFTAFVTNIIQIQFILQILKKVTLDTINYKKNVVQKR